ncbi:beta-1,3-N-acetylglucosaminyltransferase radical fringe [Ciona intestinalis]
MQNQYKFFGFVIFMLVLTTIYFSHLVHVDYVGTKIFYPHPYVSRHGTSNRSLLLEDIFITVKTSKQFHTTRLTFIVNTWFNQAKEQIFFVTDDDDIDLHLKTNGHVVNSHCGNTHELQDLSCKTGKEYDLFMATNKKWWCHFDDDNYVNINALVKFLGTFNWQEDFYIGRRSVTRKFGGVFHKKHVKFIFATGGAGVCISSALAKKMSPWSKNGEFLKTSKHLKHTDDCTLGFIITNLLNVDLTLTDFFHSHLETMATLNPASFSAQVTLAHGAPDNVIIINNNTTNTTVFNTELDPSRFYSLHCLIFPELPMCKISSEY